MIFHVQCHMPHTRNQSSTCHDSAMSAATPGHGQLGEQVHQLFKGGIIFWAFGEMYRRRWYFDQRAKWLLRGSGDVETMDSG